MIERAEWFALVDVKRAAHFAVGDRELRSPSLELAAAMQHFELRRHVAFMPTPTPTTMALEELDWLRTLAIRLAASSDADDLVQETVLAAWRRPPQLSPTRPLRSWLATVARNQVRLEARARRRREQREHASADVANPSVVARPDDELHRVRVLQALSAALDELDELDRRIIVRRFLDEENATQIGERLGLPASTVRSRLRRALVQLRASLDRRCGGRREIWALALLGPGPRIEASASTVSVAAKLGVFTVGLGALAAFSGSSCKQESRDEPMQQAVAPESEPSERQRWEQRRAHIRAALAEHDDIEVATADPETIEQARRDALASARAGFKMIKQACMEDLESDVSGALTLSATIIGDPKIGTIFESVEVVTETVADPQLIECVRESMLGFVGDPPALPVETRSVTTTQWVGRDEDDSRKEQRMFDAIVGAHHGEIAACQRNDGFDGSGTAVLELTIGADRRAAEARVIRTDLPDTVVECIVKAGLRWAFPEQLSDGVFRYELQLPVQGYDRFLGG